MKCLHTVTYMRPESFDWHHMKQIENFVSSERLLLVSYHVLSHVPYILQFIVATTAPNAIIFIVVEHSIQGCFF